MSCQLRKEFPSETQTETQTQVLSPSYSPVTTQINMESNGSSSNDSDSDLDLSSLRKPSAKPTNYPNSEDDTSDNEIEEIEGGSKSSSEREHNSLNVLATAAMLPSTYCPNQSNYQQPLGIAINPNPVSDPALPSPVPQTTTAASSTVTAPIYDSTATGTAVPLPESSVTVTVATPQTTTAASSTVTAPIYDQNEKIDYDRIVSKRQWYNAIQEPCKEKDENVQSYYKRYPTIWKMVDKYNKFWLKQKWERPCSYKVHANFKAIAVKYIVNQREKVSKSLFRDITNLLTNENKNLRGREILVYVKESFEEYAWNTYRIDLQARAKTMKATINDTIRLFEVAAIDVHRDDLTFLTRGRADHRSDLDGAQKREDEIFGRWKEVFEDESKVFQRPVQIRDLTEFENLDPNDLSRIKLIRDVNFYIGLYKRNMGEFKITVKKYTSDTGGGSGNPLHLLTWNEDSLNDFANYGGGKGNAIRKIWLTYLLLLDIQSQYAFSASFNPPPAETVMEDGTPASNTQGGGRNSVSKNNKSSDGGIEMLCGTVNGSVKELAQAVISANQQQQPVELTREERRRMELQDLDAAITLNNRLEKQRTMYNSLPDNDKMKKLKLRTNKRAIKKAAMLTREIANIPSSELSSSGDDSGADDSDGASEGDSPSVLD